MGIHWEKESFGFLVDVYVSVSCLSASLKIHGDLACHAKE